MLEAPAAAAFAGIAIGTPNMGRVISELQVPPSSVAQYGYFAFTNDGKLGDGGRKRLRHVRSIIPEECASISRATSRATAISAIESVAIHAVSEVLAVRFSLPLPFAFG